MILVDTSIWIRFLKGTEPYARDMDRLLSRDEVLGHDFVYGELLIGDQGSRKNLLADYALMPQAIRVHHEEVAEFVRRRKLAGRGVGWIDAHLLASAFLESSGLWTADRPLADLAQHLGVAYESFS